MCFSRSGQFWFLIYDAGFAAFAAGWILLAQREGEDIQWEPAGLPNKDYILWNPFSISWNQLVHLPNSGSVRILSVMVWLYFVSVAWKVVLLNYVECYTRQLWFATGNYSPRFQVWPRDFDEGETHQGHFLGHSDWRPQCGIIFQDHLVFLKDCFNRWLIITELYWSCRLGKNSSPLVHQDGPLSWEWILYWIGHTGFLWLCFHIYWLLFFFFLAFFFWFW